MRHIARVSMLRLSGPHIACRLVELVIEHSSVGYPHKLSYHLPMSIPPTAAGAYQAARTLAPTASRLHTNVLAATLRRPDHIWATAARTRPRKRSTAAPRHEQHVEKAARPLQGPRITIAIMGRVARASQHIEASAHHVGRTRRSLPPVDRMGEAAGKETDAIKHQCRAPCRGLE